MPRAKKSAKPAARPSTGPKVAVLSRDVEHAKQVKAEEAAHVARAAEYQRDADEAKALGLNVDPRIASLNAAHEQVCAEKTVNPDA